MNISSPLYVARRVLLDALEALAEHRRALILVGAQAVYAHTDDADLEVIAPYTTDADLSIDPARIADEPTIIAAMSSAGFQLKNKGGAGGTEPGTWLMTTVVDGVATLVPVDLIIPEAFATGHGRRDARLPGHGPLATRFAAGLEAALLNNEEMPIASLEPEVDSRTATIRVAGVAAVLVAKAHKVGERLTQPAKEHRIHAKDCGDVIRLMRSRTRPEIVASRLGKIRLNEKCTASVDLGLDYLERHFGTPSATGVDLAVTALASGLEEDTIRALAPAYIRTLRRQLERCRIRSDPTGLAPAASHCSTLMMYVSTIRA